MAAVPEIPLPPALTGGIMVQAYHLTPPANPPTVTDVARAVQYKDAVALSQTMGSGLTDADVCAAAEFEASVVAARNINAAPPWFQAAMVQINGQFDAINNRLTAIEETLDRVAQRLDRGPVDR